MNRRLAWVVGLGLAALAVGLAVDAPNKPDPEVGKSYRVPYRMTDTNHFLVRVRIDGKGPFNFLVDTGAPSVYIGLEAAKKIGLNPDPDEFFTPIGRLEFEGGASLTGMKARVEDVFQMVGMNASLGTAWACRSTASSGSPPWPGSRSRSTRPRTG